MSYYTYKHEQTPDRPGRGSRWFYDGKVVTVDYLERRVGPSTGISVICHSDNRQSFCIPLERWFDRATPIVPFKPNDPEPQKVELTTESAKLLAKTLAQELRGSVKCCTCNDEGVYAEDGTGPWDCYACGRKADGQQKELFEVMRLTEQHIDRALVGINLYNHPEAYRILASLKNAFRREASSKVPYRGSRISAKVTETLANVLVETARNLGLQTSSADSILLSECLELLKAMEKMAKATPNS